MDAAAYGNTVLLVEFDHHFARILPCEIEEDDRGSPFDGRESEDGDTCDFVEPIEDALGHRHLVLVDFMVECIDGGIEPGEANCV